MYPKNSSGGVPASPDLPAVERDVLDHWAADKTFVASVEQRAAGTNEYVFYDGPPFANGLPHYGHLLTGYVKDGVPRYQTMRGRRGERRFGWDCHGLPAEVEAEKQLDISTKAEILELGVGRFNEACRASVLRYTQDWERYVTRQARWVDFANDYKTLDLNYMESVMWAFRTLHDKGLIYEGFRVLAYCWRCETPLSNTETRMDDVYRDRQDPAATVRFRLETGEDLLVWTTTPWTLPSNLAVAVGADVEYAVFEANKPVLRDLKDRGLVVRHDTYTHSYPHCWRCDNPLVYKAVSSWFVAVTRFRDRMVELNEQITWTPDHVKNGSFGKWLAGA